MLKNVESSGRWRSNSLYRIAGIAGHYSEYKQYYYYYYVNVNVNVVVSPVT